MTTSEAFPMPTRFHGPQADDAQPEVAAQRNVEYVYVEAIKQVLTVQPTSPQSTPPRVVLVSDGSDTTPSEIATPRGQSPVTVDRRGALDGCQVDWGVTCEADKSFTRLTENKKPSGSSVTASTTDNAGIHRESRAQPRPLGEETFVTNGLVEQPSGSSVTASTTDEADTHRELGAQPTPPGETPGANGPDAQPRDVSMLQGDDPARFDWRVDLKDNSYKYDSLGEPVGTPNREGGDIQLHGTCSLYGCRGVGRMTK